MKHLFVSVSVKQNFFGSVFVHKSLMMLNDAEYITFKMFVKQLSKYLFVISFQLMFYKTLHYSLARVNDETEGSFPDKCAVQYGNCKNHVCYGALLNMCCLPS